MDYLEILRAIPDLEGVPDPDLNWLIERAVIKNLKAGEYLFKPNDPIDYLHIILEGTMALKAVQHNQQRIVAQMGQGSITSLLPYSRAKASFGYGEAVEDTTILGLHKEHFKELIAEHHELTAALVHVMSSRIRSFTKQQQQNEKMMALGKLSASLSHELNNPSAAVVRSAKELSNHLRLMPDGFKKVIRIQISDTALDALNDYLFDHLSAGQVKMSMMERSSRVDDLMDWLDDNGVDDSDEVAETFVDFNISADDLSALTVGMADQDRSAVIAWMNQNLITEKLVSEIKNASERIHELVRSVKSYTHMDQAQEKQRIDLHVGIENTLTMLNHKLRKGNIEVVREFMEGPLEALALPGEMNQVWTNLIDNAIDAMMEVEERRLLIHTKKDAEFINVYIIDSGPGIPEDIQDKIFDPFFTTKEMGQGTGLGLEVVHQIVQEQHNGRVYLESRPGHTQFMVCIPING
ncbi:MAG: cyclic nucleotide-binding domain-containing protein [Flavobacteriales bacterium]|nr:cyclic nucleotide-binding domain-containing protein [Flavobacteriales bacterium]